MLGSPTSSDRAASRAWPSWLGSSDLGGRRSSSTTTGEAAPSRPGWPARRGVAGPTRTRIEGFWQQQGFASTRVASEWRFDRREELEAVLHNEFPPELAEELCQEHQSLAVEVHYRLYHRRY